MPRSPRSSRPTNASFHARRSGITLLEVLVSMFIMLFGLMGVASLFPVGKYHVSQAQKYDRASAVGQRAMEEIRVRGLLRPSRWNLQNGSGFTSSSNWRTTTVMFDPLGVAGTPASSNFPHTGPAHIPRVTWRTAETSGTNLPLNVAQQMFTSHDDLVLELPGTRSIPAQQRINTGVEREYTGDFSWAFTASPAPEVGEGYYLVSVLVYQKRQIALEWTDATISAGNGYGSGRIQVSNANQDLIDRLRVGEWLMLSVAADRIFNWYQITSVGRNNQDGTMLLSVKGPDWPPAYIGNVMRASIPTGVVAVYQQMMRVESDSEWNAF